MSCCDWLGGWGFGLEWDRGGSVSAWLSSALCFWGLTFSVTFLSSSSWLNDLKTQFFVGTDHKHIPDYSLSVPSFYPDSFLLRQYNMCLILSDSHVYKSAYMCTHVQYTLFEQSITVTIIDDYTCPFFELSACFFFSSWFPVDELCCKSLKKGKWLLWFFTLSFISGFVDILMKPFFN